MKIDKSGIRDEDKTVAIQMLNELRSGKRTIGNPAEGLKKTLIELEKKEAERNTGLTDFKKVDATLRSDIMKVKAGIKGEQDFSDFVARLLKYNAIGLDGIVCFSSLSFERESEDKDYIPDTDFIFLYGKNVLVVDAKNVSTNENNPIFLDENRSGMFSRRKATIRSKT